MTAARALAFACLLVLAGCANPLGAEETPTEGTPAPLVMDEATDTASPTPDSEPGDRTTTPDQTATPDGTVTPRERNASDGPTFPPGVSRQGIDDVDALFRNHSRALERTGFVAVGNGTSVVSSSGLLVDVETDQRNKVAANGTPYEIRRDVAAGPIGRSVHVWSNGSVEYVHRQDSEGSNYTAGEPRPMVVRTGNGLLGPYVRGGNFTLQEVRNTSENRTLVALGTTEIANETVLGRAVTDDAEEIVSYRAAVAIDERGRIHALEATIEYVINGQTATQEFTYTLTSIGDVEVPEPGWLDNARSATNESAGESSDEDVGSNGRDG